MKLQLIANWRSAWRMFSVQALAFIAFAQGVLAVLPASALYATVPFAAGTTWNDLLVALTIAAAVLGGLGRLIDQGIQT